MLVFLVAAGLYYGLGLNKTIGQPADRGVSGTDAFVMCKQFVTNQLTAPATAQFPSSIEEGVNIALVGSQQYQVRAFVDSQNGFGAMIRTHYICTVQHTEGANWRLVDMKTTD